MTRMYTDTQHDPAYKLPWETEDEYFERREREADEFITANTVI